MFSHNGNDPISSSDQAFHCMPFDFESNININTTSSSSNSKQETNSDLLFPPFSFLHFPSPFEDDEIFLEHQHLDFLLQFQHQQPLTEPLTEPEPEPESEPVVNMEVSIKKKFPSKHMASEQIPRKRTGKRDRHSKINTARGPRDRRMRLSLEVARRFFGLQDLLGFDKASKTVEWLLNQSKVEINQLALKSVASSTSECEGVSSLEEVVVNNGKNKKKEMKEAQAVVKRKVKHSRRSAIFHPLARECRKRARERARERTKEKLRSKQCREEATNHKLMSQLGINNPFGTGEECGTQSSQSVINPSLNLVTEAKNLSSLSMEYLRSTNVEANMMHDDSLAFVNKRSPSMILSSLNSSGLLQEISLN